MVDLATPLGPDIMGHAAKASAQRKRNGHPAAWSVAPLRFQASYMRFSSRAEQISSCSTSVASFGGFSSSQILGALRLCSVWHPAPALELIFQGLSEISLPKTVFGKDIG